jgi:hypothetical protein
MSTKRGRGRPKKYENSEEFLQAERARKARQREKLKNKVNI